MGDRELSQLLRHRKSIAPDVPDDFSLSICYSRLPRNVQAILDGQPACGLDAAARCTRRISEAAPMSILASVLPFSINTALLQRSQNLPPSCGGTKR
jgi:hypothetical protein